MTEVSRVELVSLGMRPPVHVDLAPDVRGAFEDHDDPLLLRKLDDLHRIRRRHQARTAGRETVAFGIVLRLVLRVVVVQAAAQGWNGTCGSDFAPPRPPPPVVPTPPPSGASPRAAAGAPRPRPVGGCFSTYVFPSS